SLIAGVRVACIDGRFIANPTFEELEQSNIDLVIAASAESIIMVEGEAQEISEEEMVQALSFGHEEIRKIIALQDQIVGESGKEKKTMPEAESQDELQREVAALCSAELETLIRIPEKSARREGIQALAEKVKTALAEKYPEKETAIMEFLHEIEKGAMRRMVLTENKRLDGRNPDQIRDISIEVGILPRAHGSALFTRGQTQALAATTLGTKIDEQRIEELEGEFRKTYMLHYNFPSFSTGEVKPNRGVSRREVGHGNLAERALKPMIPGDKIFPYTLRIVSDVLESNGSSSMATVCAGSLSLMDAGVPVKDAVAGIAMGLIKEGERIAILTDILGDEDHLGDMDFKVAGTRNGITAFQMDIKITGISTEIMREALDRAKKARQFVLEKMAAVLARPRAQLSRYAPRILSIKIPVDSIGKVIGPGGKNIREIIERTGAAIDISDDGTVIVASVDPDAGEKAAGIIRDMTAEVEIGAVYSGRVKRIMKFGAFVEVLPGKEGLVHISELDHKRVGRVEDVVRIGDEVKVKVIKIDNEGRVDLSRKALLTAPSNDKAE
ncbi:polyribonucleotide nucleotidyltransferase, partial [bacterium]|nr:polyribonucleotide nucleotidyltransferase [bacterium]